MTQNTTLESTKTPLLVESNSVPQNKNDDEIATPTKEEEVSIVEALPLVP